ncbi:uncharacterized protein CC84DRAFT_414680 [Paraphaeosphaeria sporulosa]|uniref:Bacteriophage T5 Orf172 DNA-binding domain-containing protein n=1 Tax=Paraphaeosphaeria sporulosa TaxID=1460663 RepID=A0A177BXH4_9PLEO|nr:uncharacterized protein CC84DRAFT_414680 [Paraphaeosphaeria sporulosa]OAF99029.1 hypothetical protein CC84DRAFT_414680 [Paraphaeosphaeria sporulosa]
MSGRRSEPLCGTALLSLVCRGFCNRFADEIYVYDSVPQCYDRSPSFASCCTYFLKIAFIKATMASRLSPLAHQIPPLHLQHDHAPPPRFSLYDKHQDTTSYASGSPVIAHEHSRHARSQSIPSPVQQSLEKSQQSGLPIRHDWRRPCLPKEPRSSPDSSTNIGASISNEDSNQTPDLQKNKIPSPCGKKHYSSEAWLKRHKDTCAVCTNIKYQVEEIFDTTSASKRQPILESEDTCATNVIEEQLRGSGGVLSSVNLEASEDLEADRHWAPSQPKIDDFPDIVRAATLGLEDECNAEGAPVSNSVKLEITATELHNKVRAVLEKELTPNDSDGYIYIFSDPKRPELHKIGKSKETISRMGQLRYQCGLTLKLVKNVKVHNYSRTERLIQTYLMDLCRPYRCDVCHASHGEWFEIADGSARAAVTRWAKFMTREGPYDPETRQLHSFAEDLVRTRDHLLPDASPKIETTRNHWNRILSPTFLDRFRFKFNVIWTMVSKFCWPINSMFAWTVAFLASRHPITFLFMAVSVIGTFISISDEQYRLRNRPKRSKRRSI